MAVELIIRERGHSWAGRPPVTSVHASRAAAEEELSDYVRRNWAAEMAGRPPQSDPQMVAEYFAEVLETYEIRVRSADLA